MEPVAEIQDAMTAARRSHGTGKFKMGFILARLLAYGTPRPNRLLYQAVIASYQ